MIGNKILDLSEMPAWQVAALLAAAGLAYLWFRSATSDRAASVAPGARAPAPPARPRPPAITPKFLPPAKRP